MTNILANINDKVAKFLIATGIVAVAFGAGETQYQKGGLLYDGISTSKVVSKFSQADNKIKSKYQLDGTALKINTMDKNSVAVTLGDKTKPEFEPKLEINRWEDKTKFSIKPNGLEDIQRKDKDLIFDGGSIKFETPNITYEFYDAPTSSEEGGYEYQLILTSKPSTSTFYSTIESTGLEFYKQLPLTQEEIDNGNQRPENVINSYAVYYQGSPGDYSQMGGYNFRAGKAFHIYRIKATDADGQWIWCDQNIYGTTHEIICDPNWLEKVAKYPVKIDPTFGYTSVGASSYAIGLNYGAVYRFTSNITSISYIKSYIQASGSNQYVKTLVYNTSRALLTNGASNPTKIPTYAEGVDWSTSTFSTSPTLSSGTDYLLGATCNADSPSFRFDSGTSNYGGGGTINYTSPGTAPTLNNNRKISIYATYEEPTSTSSLRSSTSLQNGRLNLQNGRLKIQ